ncbi:MAG: DUF6544 family protein [Mesorhizobium sp.]
MNLPTAVMDLAHRLGASPEFCIAVRLTQSGTMQDKPEARTMHFSAVQRILLQRPEFEWTARTGPLGLISVTDALRGGEPHLAVKALGWIPVASAPPDPQVAKGEMMRYLAELAWAPDAILQNPYLVWRVLDQDRLSVSLDSGSARAEIEIGLDREGRIFSVFAPDRPRKEGSRFVERPWSGRFSNYRRHAGRWLPFSGEVGWELGGEEFIAWRGELTSWSFER